MPLHKDADWLATVILSGNVGRGTVHSNVRDGKVVKVKCLRPGCGSSTESRSLVAGEAV
jgi:tRNA A37 threonylcarbamoyladenosine synthetase subunit TsaC/SUA5/YrdC